MRLADDHRAMGEKDWIRVAAAVKTRHRTSMCLTGLHVSARCFVRACDRHGQAEQVGQGCDANPNLVSNPQARWIVDGVAIVDEVLVFAAPTLAMRATPILSDEDEGVFRSAMTRRDVPVADVDLESLEGEGVEPAAELKQIGETGA